MKTTKNLGIQDDPVCVKSQSTDDKGPETLEEVLRRYERQSKVLLVQKQGGQIQDGDYRSSLVVLIQFADDVVMFTSYKIFQPLPL